MYFMGKVGKKQWYQELTLWKKWPEKKNLFFSVTREYIATKIIHLFETVNSQVPKILTSVVAH